MIAQNGIKISRGATAVVQGNTVSQNIFTLGGTVSTGILLFQSVATAPVCVQFDATTMNDAGIALSDNIGSLIQGNNSSNNTQLGILVESDAINTALNNPTFDIADFSTGLFSAFTGNIYVILVIVIIKVELFVPLQAHYLP